MTKHIESLMSNMDEINRLLEIHTELSGGGVGRKHNVEVLNKSAVVLLLACWEAYVEDIAAAAFDYMLHMASSPVIFPEHVLAIAAKELKKADTLAIWAIAKNGWKSELKSHRDRILEKYVVRGSFNTPSAANVDRLFSELLGFNSVSSNWTWPGVSCEASAEKLVQLIELRGNIAHRVNTVKPVKRADVVSYKKFIYRLAVITHNRTSKFIHERTQLKPWRRYAYDKTR